MNGLLHVSSSPHARSKVTTDKIMFAVLLALAPAVCVGIWNFGLRALLLIVISMAVCPLTEYLYEKGMKKPVTIADGSALVTGLLLAMNMPVQAPLWMPVIGGVFAILVVKQLFGGLGQNIMNPALAGRCFLLISFPGHMTREGNQKETSSCKRRVHDVLAKTAEKLFYNENCKHTTDHRHPKRCLHRHVHCQQKTSYQCTAVGNRHRFLHSFFIQIFRQGTDCHRNHNQKQCPKAEIPDSHADCRGKGKQDGKHDFVCRHLGPRVWGR